MTDPFVGEIRINGFNFAPRGWASCDGQLLPVSQNTLLFSIVGNAYGGDGRTTFGLPDLRGRAPMMWGRGPGLTPRSLGERGGAAEVAIGTDEMPDHTHTLHATSMSGRSGDPDGKTPAMASGAAPYSTEPPDVDMSPAALELAGEGAPHENRQPYTTLNFCIALQGVFPPRP